MDVGGHIDTLDKRLGNVSGNMMVEVSDIPGS